MCKPFAFKELKKAEVQYEISPLRFGEKAVVLVLPYFRNVTLTFSKVNYSEMLLACKDRFH